MNPKAKKRYAKNSVSFYFKKAISFIKFLDRDFYINRDSSKA